MPSDGHLLFGEEDDDDELDIDALFFLPEGILDTDDSDIGQLPASGLSWSDDTAALTADFWLQPRRTLFQVRQGSSTSHNDDQEPAEFEGEDQVKGIPSCDLLQSPPFGLLPTAHPHLGFAPNPANNELPLVTRLPQPTNHPGNLEHNHTIKESDGILRGPGPTKMSSVKPPAPTILATPDKSTKDVAVKSNVDLPPASSVVRAPNVSDKTGTETATPHQAESIFSNNKSMAALNEKREVILDVDNVAAADADEGSVGSSDDSSDCGLYLTTQKSSTMFDTAGTVESSSEASKRKQIDDSVASVGVLGFLQIRRLLPFMQSFLKSCIVEPILFLQQLFFDWCYHRPLAQALIDAKRFLRALRVAVESAFIASSVIASVSTFAFSECFVSLPPTKAGYTLPSVFCYIPTKSAYIYFVFLFTPMVCDIIMDYISLPHFSPHVLSSLALFSCFDSSHHDRTRVPGRLSFHFSSNFRWTPFFMLGYDGFGDTNISLMRFDATRRTVLAFGAALLHHSLILSPLVWVLLTVQELFILLCGSSSIATSVVLAVGSLATLHHLRALTTTGRKR